MHWSLFIFVINHFKNNIYSGYFIFQFQDYLENINKKEYIYLFLRNFKNGKSKQTIQCLYSGKILCRSQ